MLFDWFTVFAQIVNFLILMWLLKRFLYKPVLNAIDAREKRIADLLIETQQNQQNMFQQESELTRKNQSFAVQRESLLEQTKIEAADAKAQLLNKASAEVEIQRKQWLDALEKEQSNFEHEIRQGTQDAVFQVARKALQDLSNIELQSHIVNVFIERLETLSSEQQAQFASTEQSPLVICSAIALSDENKRELKRAIDKHIAGHSTLHFDLNPSLVSGIEMSGSGHKLSWNIDDYLANVEGSIARLAQSKIRQHQRLFAAQGVFNVASE